jgi:hypothetical protein
LFTTLVHKAFAQEDVEQREKEQLRLQKKDKKKLEAASRLYNKQVAHEAKAARQRERERKKEGKEAQAKELAASRSFSGAQTTTTRCCNLTIFFYNTHNKGNQAASHKAEKIHQNVVGLWLLQARLLQNLRRHLLPPKPPRAAAKSEFHLDKNKTSCAQAFSNYDITECRNNSYCG